MDRSHYSVGHWVSCPVHGSVSGEGSPRRGEVTEHLELSPNCGAIPPRKEAEPQRRTPPIPRLTRV